MSLWKHTELLPLTSLALVFLAVLTPASGEISAERLRQHTTVLASDAFEGRAPGTAGEDKTIRYLETQFREMGLKPGNPDGTYLQAVPLVGITSEVETQFTAGDQTWVPQPINEYSALSRRVTPTVKVQDSEIVFVGYGVQAPEYQWDDYKDVDVKGKTLVMLINDPPVMDPVHPDQLDANVFRGRAMTYYGRWTYKYDIAAAKGAAACLIVHETGPAGYPFAVVGSTAGREHFDLEAPDKNLGRAAVEAWMTWDFSQKLFASAGLDLAELKKKAARRDFRPVTLKARASFGIKNTVRHVASHNVVARLDGRDPAQRNEYVIYTAHWDHLGRDERLTGDQIFNGASDNASGTAMLLELAQTFAALPEEKRPARSVLFLSVTAEEKGLLGSRHYAENPLYPLNRTVANINMDGANTFAPTKDVEVIGSGATTIEDVAREIVTANGRILAADTQPERGFYYRSDHFEFAKVGVPAFYGKAGRQPLNKPDDYIDRKRTEYTTADYHKVSDDLKPDWDFQAVAQEVEFLWQLGTRLADSDTWPSWKPGSEFKARRDAQMKR